MAEVLFFELGLMFSLLLAMPYVLYYWYIRGKAQNAVYSEGSPLDSNAVVSILICTLNAAKTIEKKIEEVATQALPLKNTEVIVVDGGSVDETLKILDKMKSKMSGVTRFVVVRNQMFSGKASQINAGFRIATGRYVIATDADCETHPDAFRILIGTLSGNGIGAVCARQVLANPDENLITGTEVTYRRFYEVLRIGESSLHSTPVYHGGLSAYRMEAYSPIEEDVNADDTQLALGAVRNGFRALYETRGVFRTRSPSDLVDSNRQRIRRGQGLQRVFWRNRDMISRRRFGYFGFPICAAEFFMHIISPLVFVVASTFLLTSATMLAVAAPSLTILLMIPIAFFLFWRRNWSPVMFVASFALYQFALFCAMILHLAGYNYRRWSRKQST